MRLKIWEGEKMQCSIIGTCLSLGELKKIARQCRLDLDQSVTEYELHTYFVHLCARPGKAAKAVNKYLDRKYGGAIRKFSAAKDQDALLALWEEARSAGNIPGPYWALMTLQDVDDELRMRVFGDVHMLSHLVGSSNRADIRRLADLEEESQGFREKMATLKGVYRKRFKELIGENKELHRRLKITITELESLRSRSKEYCTEMVHGENVRLKGSLAMQSDHLAEAKAHGKRLEQRNGELADRNAELEQSFMEKQAEVEFLELELARLMNRVMDKEASGLEEAACAECSCDLKGSSDCPGPSLCGKRILYVGGRTNLVRHYRDLVERKGGTFVHHDGGVEHSDSILHKLLKGVDAVLCPVDCVSHNACQCVKEVCKHRLTPCKLLRSAGLSSLAKSLEELDLSQGAEHSFQIQQ